MSQESKTKTIRDGFGEGLLELGQDPRVIALTADLASSVKMNEFANKFPERFIQVGIAEQNMAGIAAGLSLCGKVPFIGSFACFQPMRNLDQIRTSICIMNQNVKIVSSHAGFSFPADGVQIQALEDLAIMRTLPNTTVLIPADAEQAKRLTLAAVDIAGPVYLRLGRAEAKTVSSYAEEKEVEVGKVQKILSGKRVVVFANGYMIQQTYAAIMQSGISDIGFYNVHTLKPLNAAEILAAVKGAKGVVTVEEHQIHGGLGSAIAEILAQNLDSPPLKIIGVPDRFGQTAQTQEEMWEEYGLGKEEITNAILSFS